MVNAIPVCVVLKWWMRHILQNSVFKNLHNLRTFLSIIIIIIIIYFKINGLYVIFLIILLLL